MVLCLMNHSPSEAQREHVSSSHLWQTLFLADMAGSHVLKLEMRARNPLPGTCDCGLKKSLILPLKRRVP